MRATKYGWLLFLFVLSFSAKAQNVMTSSPYSMFGIGEIATDLSGANAAMGGVSTAMRGKALINTDNPAGLVGLDTCRLLAETSAFIKWEYYRSRGSNQAFTGNFSRFAMAGRIMPRWYMGFGLTPYSVVGYYFQTEQQLEGSVNTYYTSTFTGEGGLSKLFLSNAFAILPSLSVGVNMNYIFGTISNSEEQSTMSISQELYGQAFLVDFGLQYSRRLSKDLNVTVGAVYGLPQTMRVKRSQELTDNSTVITTKLKRINQKLPQYIGGGVSVEYKNMTYALDYTFREYSTLYSSDGRMTYINSNELRAGACYSPNGYSSQSIWKRMDYKIGLDISTPYYMQVKGSTGPSFRVTAGLSIPIIGGKLHTAFFYDHTQLSSNALTRGITGFTVTYTLSELFYRIKL